MENVLNVRNSDTASLVAVSTQGSRDCGPLSGVREKKMSSFLQEKIPSGFHLSVLYASDTEESAPVNLSVAPNTLSCHCISTIIRLLVSRQIQSSTV